MRRSCIWIALFLAGNMQGQSILQKLYAVNVMATDTGSVSGIGSGVQGRKFISTSEFIDAAINSLNAFNSLIKKENYRSMIISLNNPAGTDLGFNLETEIHEALKPLLEKAKSTNTVKFSEIISRMISASATISGTPIPGGSNPLLATLLSLVGNLVVQEKKITKDDLDLFVRHTSGFFVQYEKLARANFSFDQNIRKLNSNIQDLHFDIREYMLDMITILYKNIQRTQLKDMNAEELLLKYLDKQNLEQIFRNVADSLANQSYRYPSDGIKTSKEIAYGIQKLFIEYQKIYNENYREIREILTESKALDSEINIKQIDASLKELETLYNESRSSDILGLRLNTLFERLKNLASTDQE